MKGTKSVHQISTKPKLMNVNESHKVYENTLRNKVCLNFKIFILTLIDMGTISVQNAESLVNPNETVTTICQRVKVGEIRVFDIMQWC